jgi:hypothetical protein
METVERGDRTGQPPIDANELRDDRITEPEQSRQTYCHFPWFAPLKSADRLATAILLMPRHDQKAVHAGTDRHYTGIHGVVGYVFGHTPTNSLPAVFHGHAECHFAQKEIYFHDFDLT